MDNSLEMLHLGRGPFGPHPFGPFEPVLAHLDPSEPLSLGPLGPVWYHLGPF